MIAGTTFWLEGITVNCNCSMAGSMQLFAHSAVPECALHHKHPLATPAEGAMVMPATRAAGRR